MKKAVVILVSLVMVLLLFTACGGDLSSSTDYSQEAEIEKTPLEKVGEYIVSNGVPDGTTYRVTKDRGEGTKSCLIWNDATDELFFESTIEYEENDSLYGVDVTCGEGDSEAVMVWHKFTDPAKTYEMHCELHKSSFPSNGSISSVENNNPLNDEPEKTLAVGAALAISYAEEMLAESATGVTLQDLGFSSWKSLSK